MTAAQVPAARRAEVHDVRAVAVFCSSRPHRVFEPLASHLGGRLARAGIGVVYGGGGVGLMGAVARGARAAGGLVQGVAPHDLFQDERRSTPAGVEPHVVTGGAAGMHQRKRLMYRLADACLVLPGGLGTLDELAEAACWTQLGVHDRQPRKSVVLINWVGATGEPFFGDFARHLSRAVAERLLTPSERLITHVAAGTDAALAHLGIPYPPAVVPPATESTG